MQEAPGPGRRRRRTAAAVAAALLLSAGAYASADPPSSTQPAAGGKSRPADRSLAWHVVKRFDFDEARLGNDGDLPMYWYPFRGPDFPRYAEGCWDRAFGCNSRESFRLQLDGGNVGYFYRPNNIPIAPGQDIRVEAMVRTSELVHARALMEVFFTDARHDVIVASKRRSELLGGPGGNDRWTPIAVLVPGRFAAARYVNIRVYLLQPARWRTLGADDAAPPGQVNYIDVHGRAWFDDITVYRLPRVTLTTGQPGQILRPEQADAAVQVQVAGFPSQPLEAELAVRDAAGRLIGHQVFASQGQEEGASRQFTWHGGQLPGGLYNCELRLFAGGARLAGLPPLLKRQLTFARLPAAPKRAASHGAGFGLIIPPESTPPWPAPGRDDADENLAAALLAAEQGDTLARLPVSMVKLPLWRGQHSLEQLEQGDPWADELIRRLVRQRVGLIATFGRTPEPLAGKSAGGQTLDRTYGLRRTLLDVFSQDPTLWRPYLAFQLARYAEQVHYWQIGREDELAFALDRRLIESVQGARREFGSLLTAPTFVVTWPAIYSYRQGVAAASESADGFRPFPAEIINVFLSSRLGADTVADYLGEFAGLTGTPPWATVEPLAAEAYSRVPRLEDLAWRLTQAAAALSDVRAPLRVGGPTVSGTVFINAPWHVREADGQDALEPTEDLLIFRNVADLLAGSRYGGQLMLADGVVAWIFDRGNGRGAMAVRNLAGDPAAPIELYLGEDVQRVDLWGNRSPVPASEAGKQQLTAGRLMFFLDGIDPRLARLRASFQLDPPFVPSSYKKHVRNVRFVNCFDTPISGRITLHFPGNWEVHPKIIPFAAQPGETFNRQVEIRFPYNAEAGAKTLLADCLIDADRAYRIQMASRFDFGLGDVTVRTLNQWLGDGQLMVSVTVTNRSESALDAFCFVAAPKRPRQERVITALQPGATVVKSFRIPNARELVGQSVRVGLREVKGSRIVNYDVPVR